MWRLTRVSNFEWTDYGFPLQGYGLSSHHDIIWQEYYGPEPGDTTSRKEEAILIDRRLYFRTYLSLF